MKKGLSVILCVAAAVVFLAGCAKKAPDSGMIKPESGVLYTDSFQLFQEH